MGRTLSGTSRQELGDVETRRDGGQLRIEFRALFRESQRIDFACPPGPLDVLVINVRFREAMALRLSV